MSSSKAASQARWRARKKAEYLHLKRDNPCVDCGTQNPVQDMEYDHVRGTKIANVSRLAMMGVRLDVLAAEIAKCDMVCALCHRARTQGRLEEKRRSP